eukprot:19653-Heterococcus_DN1.PRE.1
MQYLRSSIELHFPPRQHCVSCTADCERYSPQTRANGALISAISIQQPYVQYAVQYPQTHNPRSQSASMALNYVVTAHRPTAVTHSLVAKFTGPQDVNLILAKGNRLVINMVSNILLAQLHALLRLNPCPLECEQSAQTAMHVGEEGLVGVHDVPLYGKIACLESYRPPGERQDLLFVLNEKYQFCVLGYDAKTREIKTRGNGCVSDKIGRPVDAGKLVVIDPQNRMIGLYLYEGLLK